MLPEFIQSALRLFAPVKGHLINRRAGIICRKFESEVYANKGMDISGTVDPAFRKNHNGPACAYAFLRARQTLFYTRRAALPDRDTTAEAHGQAKAGNPEYTVIRYEYKRPPETRQNHRYVEVGKMITKDNGVILPVRERADAVQAYAENAQKAPRPKTGDGNGSTLRENTHKDENEQNKKEIQCNAKAFQANDYSAKRVFHVDRPGKFIV
jgi:hypothetical protein